MSLINKALKQEQMRRSQGMQDGAAHMMAAAVSGRSRRGNQGPKILIGFMGLGLLLALSVSLFAFFGMNSLKEGEDTLAQKPSPSLAQGGEPAPSQDSSATRNQTASDSQKSESADNVDSKLDSLNLSPEDLAALKTLIAENADPGAIAKNAGAEGQAGDPSSSQADSASPAIAESVPNPEIEIFVETLVIQGARAAGDKSRLLMNGRVYRINDTIDRERGLVFKEAHQGYLVFEDQEGHRYEKTL